MGWAGEHVVSGSLQNLVKILAMPGADRLTPPSADKRDEGPEPFKGQGCSLWWAENSSWNLSARIIPLAPRM